MEDEMEGMVLRAAMIAHASNRELRAILGEEDGGSWDEIPQEQRDSIQAGVFAIQEEPDLSPEASHEKWLARKLEEGWVHGAAQDNDAKVHPCVLPYVGIPDEQKFKDTLFGAVVRAVLFNVSGREAMDRGEKSNERVDPAIYGRHPVGAAFDGEGIMIVFNDGSCCRWRQGTGWNESVPVPGTDAWLASQTGG